MGSSYDACYPAVTALGRRGVPCSMLDTAELLHFRLPPLRAGHAAGLRQPVRRERRARAPRRGARRRAPAPTVAAVTNGVRQHRSPPPPTIATRHPRRRGARPLHHDLRRRPGACCDALADADPPLRAGGARDGAPAGRARAQPPTTSCAWIDGRPTLALVGRGSRPGGGRDGRADAEGGGPLPGRVAAGRPVPARPARAGRAAAGRDGDRHRAAHPRRWSWGWPASWLRAGAAVLVVSQDGEAPDGARGDLGRPAQRRPGGSRRHRPRPAAGLAAGALRAASRRASSRIAGKVTTRE